MKYFILLLLTPLFMMAQPKVFAVELVPNQEVAYIGTLSDGIIMNDLSWAWNSNNACFVEMQKKKFSGKHVFFEGIIPQYSEVSVTVIPNDPSANFSIYAYQTGLNTKDLVPHLPRCIRCEADFFQERNRVGREEQDHTRTATNLVAMNRRYRLVIGVTGADGLSEGDFTLKIDTKTR